MRYLLAIGLATLSCQQAKRADPEIHLIPSDFRGKVQIVFRAQNGVPAKVENGAPVYVIPSDGLLFTQAEPNNGLSPEYRFFFVTPQGERNAIRRLYTSSERLSGEVGIAYLARAGFRPGSQLGATCLSTSTSLGTTKT